MQLRPYQNELITAIRASLRLGHKRVLLVSPTGSGKTALTTEIIKSAKEKGSRAYFLVHRNELVKQTSQALWDRHIEHGRIQGGRASSTQGVLVASVGTLVRRTDNIISPDLIIIDEAHRSNAPTYRKIIEAYPDAIVIGLTATPERTDGRGLGDVYEDLVELVDVADLIEMGFLCDYIVLAPPKKFNVDGVHTVAGDYNKKELAEATDKTTITGDAIEHYKRHAMGKTCIVFCVTVDHSKHVRDMYIQAGIPCEQLDGSHSEAERQAVLDRYKSGEVKVLTSVDLFIEGVDVPRIEVVQWLRKTKSMIIWRQGIGRGLRPSPGKDKLIILDHVGNSIDLGLPDDKYEWSLEGSKKKGKGKQDPAINVKQCPKCYAVFRPNPNGCPHCGDKTVQVREILQEAGELQEVDKDALRKSMKREQGNARGLEELIALGVNRGMKSPDGWAAHIYAVRSGMTKPSVELRAEAKRIYKGMGK